MLLNLRVLNPLTCQQAVRLLVLVSLAAPWLLMPRIPSKPLLPEPSIPNKPRLPKPNVP